MTFSTSIKKFVEGAVRYGHEESDFSTLASALVIKAAVDACSHQNTPDIVLNVACICETADKVSLHRFHSTLRTLAKGSCTLNAIIKVMSEVESYPHSAYNARWAESLTWDLKTFMKDLAKTPVFWDYRSSVDVFDLLLQASHGCQSAGPVAAKTIIFKFSVYYYLFHLEGGVSHRWFMCNRRNGFLTDASSRVATNFEDETTRGYFASSGTRSAVTLVCTEDPVGMEDDGISGQRHYSKVLARLRKPVLQRWDKMKVRQRFEGSVRRFSCYSLR